MFEDITTINSKRMSAAPTKINRPGPAIAADEDDKPLYIGFDWGTNTSCIVGGYAGNKEISVKEIIPTLVGYARDGIVDDLLPGNARVLFGQQALKYRLHLRLVQPMVNGVVTDLNAAREFAKHVVNTLQAPSGTEIRAVIGVPANADGAARENMRQAVAGLFHRVILVPEPFLTALGYRDESKLASPGYVDPVRNSLFVDIGAGTTDVCMIQGYYPGADDQVSFAFAGDKVDALLREAILKTYPDCDMPILKIREIKEKNSFVGAVPGPIEVNIVVGGKGRKLELSEQVGAACGQLLERVAAAVKALIARAPSDSVVDMLQNIILTGGGSQVRNIDTELQRLLADEGYEQPQVRSVGDNYKEYVARGALKAARQAREDQWQQVMI